MITEGGMKFACKKILLLPRNGSEGGAKGVARWKSGRKWASSADVRKCLGLGVSWSYRLPGSGFEPVISGG